MTTADNWGWKARIGMFIVSSEPVPEAEWWAMMPSGVSVHAARVTAPTPWARWSSNRETVELEPTSSGAPNSLPPCACRPSSPAAARAASRAAGDGMIRYQAAVRDRRPDTVVTTNGRDCQAALRALKVERPFLVFPAWFADPALPQGVA